MLRSIHIKNFAILDNLNLELHDEMTSITGETGAGKSIIIDAVALATGGRADQSMIRHGQPQAEVTLEFDLTHNSAALNWLNEHDFSLEEQHCIVRRQLFQNKPSRSFINERPVTVQSLKALGGLLITICGQQEHFNLISPRKRIETIDAHANNGADLNRIANLYTALRKVQADINQIQTAETPDDQQVDILTFLIQELQAANYSADHYHELDGQQTRLSHVTEIANVINTVLLRTKEDETLNLMDSLNASISLLQAAGKYEPKLMQISHTLTEAMIHCEDAAGELLAVKETLEFNPGELSNVEQKLSSFHDLSRKHRCKPIELEAKLIQLQERLELIQNRDNTLDALIAEERILLNDYQQLAAKLSQSRAKAASALSKSISKQLQSLNMPGAALQIVCDTDTSCIRQNGQDTIKYLVSTNKDNPPGSIEKIASGGELSRVSLAIQLETTNPGNNSMLIFDEVDAGISGETADVVGRKLKMLAKDHQVVCITHLPQVASKARHQLKVTKSKSDANVQLKYLDDQQRIEELARFLSGKKITPESLANAKVMLQESNRAQIPTKNSSPL